ncbi:MAG TPA: hypothetical protein EYN91_21050, partial [Candidatus Melainabacteria bacterium]|nr:hypothetical protein [Candidatus Melainabacteria bacterium]HIN65757.1 hypothetical protein [Candidatus Obscuribacterales bacterium]
MTVAFSPVKSIQTTRTGNKTGFPSVGIAGSGPALLTMACYLSGRGYPVQVFDRSNNLPGPASSVKAEGAISGQYD